MLRDLAIHNYRVFKDFAIDGLARVNLIVGANNAGKTSFLEAVYLLVNQDNPLSLLELLYERGEFTGPAATNANGVVSYPVAHIFRGHDPGASLKTPLPDDIITFQSRAERPLSLRLRLRPTVAQFATQQQATRPSPIVEPLAMYDLFFAYGEQSEQRILSPADISTRLPVGREQMIAARSLRPRNSSARYRFITTSSVDLAYLAELWDGITLTPKEEEVVAALKLVEPAVERLSFTSHRLSSGGVLVKLAGRSAPIPLSSMGDGMRRILALAMSVVTAEGGVLLVDEIDTGLYHGVQTDMWRLLIETARRLDVQIFATTHSWDGVQAFQEALGRSAEESLGRLFRLQRRGDDIREVKYSNKELAIAVREAIEVR